MFDFTEKDNCEVCVGMCDKKEKKHPSYSISSDLASNQQRLAQRAIEKIECLVDVGWVQISRTS